MQMDYFFLGVELVMHDSSKDDTWNDWVVLYKFLKN